MRSKTLKLLILIVFVSLVIGASYFLFNNFVKKAIESRQNIELEHGQ